MRTIVHLSDIHFGRFDDALAAPLLTTIHELASDLVVISGDLTQRARPHQFEQARAYMLSYWWVGTFPGIAITITVAGYVFLGDGLRDLLDPKLRGKLNA